MSGSVLVVDVGTSGLRTGVVRPDGSVSGLHHRAFVPSSPVAGLVEFDAVEMARLVLEVARRSISDAGPVASVGITNQRASTVVWRRSTGTPIGPALGWQDLRTVGECITAKLEHGLGLAPNQSATKVAWLLRNHVGDAAAVAAIVDDLAFGTVDTWIAWTLSRGNLHVTDHGNAAVTGLCEITAEGGPRWHRRACSALGIPMEILPSIVPSSGVIGLACALDDSPPIAALAGDQQASLIGQSCVRPHMAKCTFGTGGMMNVLLGTAAPEKAERSAHGTFPIVAWSRQAASIPEMWWASEAIMLSAGTNVEWLRDDLGIIADAAESDAVAATCSVTDGVMYVPALLGLGTPSWDYGARGALLGLTRGSGRAQVIRAVLEGVAHRGADLLDAVEADHPAVRVPEIRVDGGMSRNRTFVQALADATGRPVAVSPISDATTLGAGYLAGLATGTWSSLDEIANLWHPLSVVEPRTSFDRARERAKWADAVTRASGWIPELSGLDF